MRSITISTDVFARIWSLRELGEDTEDMILRRVLECPSPSGSDPEIAPPSQHMIGFLDARHGVSFTEGFEVFRTYRGTE